MTLAAFGLALLALSPAPGDRVVIVQTNAAGDNVFLIDPATNTIVGEIDGIEVNHGAAAAPDGSRFYFTNEANETLDVVDVEIARRDQEHPAQRPAEQRRHQSRRASGLRGDRFVSGRGRRHRHSLSRAGQDHPDARRSAQHVRHARWTARHRRVDRREEPDRHRPGDRGAPLDALLRERRPADRVRDEPRRNHPKDVRADLEFPRVLSGGLREPQRSRKNRSFRSFRRRSRTGTRSRGRPLTGLGSRPMERPSGSAAK